MTSMSGAQLREVIESFVVTIHGDAIVEARALVDALTAKVAAAEAEYARSGQLQVDGFGSMAAFARHRGGVSLPESRRIERQAKRLGALPELAEAWSDGRLSRTQVDLCVARIPERHVERFAETLAETVGILAPLNAWDTGKALIQWVGLADDAAQREAAEAGIEVLEPPPEREFSAIRSLDDVLVMNGFVDADSAAYVEKALTAASRDDIDGERRTPMQRRADALVEVCRGYLAGLRNPDANRRTERLTITADVIALYRAWLKGSGVRTAAELEAFLEARPDLGDLDRGLFLDAFSGGGDTAHTLDGKPVTDHLLASVAEHGVLELLLTLEGRILDLGRSTRIFSPAQRRAILARDRGCRTAGCDAGPERCDIHHVVPWETGGPTDIANGVAKCGRCHLEHHRKRWRDRLDADGTYTVTTNEGVALVSRPPGWNDQVPLLPLHTSGRPASALPFDPVPVDRRAGPFSDPVAIRLMDELIRSRCRLGESHPDVIELDRRIDERFQALDAA